MGKGTIKGRIAAIVTVCTVLIILLTTLVNVMTTRTIMVQDSNTLMEKEAVGNAQVIEEWLEKQGKIISTIAEAVTCMDGSDTDKIMDFLGENLKENEDAMMYYYCLGHAGAVFPADHSQIDLDPATRDWWKQAVSKNDLIYTSPYTDFATGQMIVSIVSDGTL